ncbi:MAG: calcium-binding protein, partial [Nostoc sp.]
ADIIGTNGNDTLVGGYKDTINGKGGNDTITSSDYSDIGDYTIIDFGGVGKGTNPTAAVIAEVDTLIFQGDGLTARNLQLTQNDKNLVVSFAGVYSSGSVTLRWYR